MKLETLQAIQTLLNELNSVVNTYTESGHDSVDIDAAFGEADHALEQEIKIGRA